MMKIYFLGIGGAGMSALAQYCKNRGDGVSGMDAKSSKVAEMLEQKNIPVAIGLEAKDLPQNIDMFVRTASIKPGNPLYEAAIKSGIPMKTYFEFVGDITKEYTTISVAGTHGKTSTVGMMAAGSKMAGFDASMIGGAFIKEFDGANFHAGTNEYLILESCEYKRHFHLLSPDIVLLTNVEWEHVDVYPTFEEYKESFKVFLEKAKVVIYHENDEVAVSVLEDFEGLKIPVAQNVPGTIKLSVLGRFNQDNAALALTCAQHLGLDEEKFRKGLEEFGGAARRQEYLGEKFGVKIYDDYGHHPTAVRKTLEAFRQKFMIEKIGLLFEPLLSRSEFFEEFVECFDLADQVGLFPVYIPGKGPDKESLQFFLDRKKGLSIIDGEVAMDAFLADFDQGDVVVCMGAGKISYFVREYVK